MKWVFFLSLSVSQWSLGCFYFYHHHFLIEDLKQGFRQDFVVGSKILSRIVRYRYWYRYLVSSRDFSRIFGECFSGFVWRDTLDYFDSLILMIIGNFFFWGDSSEDFLGLMIQLQAPPNQQRIFSKILSDPWRSSPKLYSLRFRNRRDFSSRFHWTRK